MATATSICSNAVLMLGAQVINDLYNDPTDRAALASNLYPEIRDALLRSHPWNCAIARVSLAPDAVAPPFDWAYRFPLPADWLKTLSVGEYGYEVEFRIEGRFVLSNDNPCLLRYIFQNTNESTWDSMLVAAMTLAVKAACAYPITMSQAVADSAQAELANFLKRARAVDGQDDSPETLGDFRLLGSRFVGGIGLVK
jgi:hypothetical protein